MTRLVNGSAGNWFDEGRHVKWTPYDISFHREIEGKALAMQQSPEIVRSWFIWIMIGINIFRFSRTTREI